MYEYQATDHWQIVPLCLSQGISLEFEGKDYSRLIWKRAMQHHFMTGRDVEDLFQEASLGFVKACKAWKKREGDNTIKFSTFLFQKISFQFITEGNKYRDKVQEVRQAGTEYEYHFRNIHTPEEDPADSFAFRSSLERLSGDAEEVVKVVFNCPEEIARLTKTSLRRFFCGIGWTDRRIDIAFAKISRMLES